ncbi:hypothetical protein DPMN_033930 [Dreissena polymorpha]|uniref:Uncharacterized protein n=1 Tax=Dreissena polymorpha TaxID=45954 RepID=A0A9D4M4P9_DREPO|nr:hypothetical protein DPMN_033930 [Dreissena polymorpha]
MKKYTRYSLTIIPGCKWPLNSQCIHRGSYQVYNSVIHGLNKDTMTVFSHLSSDHQPISMDSSMTLINVINDEKARHILRLFVLSAALVLVEPCSRRTNMIPNWTV